MIADGNDVIHEFGDVGSFGGGKGFNNRMPLSTFVFVPGPAILWLFPVDCALIVING